MYPTWTTYHYHFHNEWKTYQLEEPCQNNWLQHICTIKRYFEPDQEVVCWLEKGWIRIPHPLMCSGNSMVFFGWLARWFRNKSCRVASCCMCMYTCQLQCLLLFSAIGGSGVLNATCSIKFTPKISQPLRWSRWWYSPGIPLLPHYAWHQMSTCRTWLATRNTSITQIRRVYSVRVTKSCGKGTLNKPSKELNAEDSRKPRTTYLHRWSSAAQSISTHLWWWQLLVDPGMTSGNSTSSPSRGSKWTHSSPRAHFSLWMSSIIADQWPTLYTVACVFRFCHKLWRVVVISWLILRIMSV